MFFFKLKSKNVGNCFCAPFSGDILY